MKQKRLLLLVAVASLGAMLLAACNVALPGAEESAPTATEGEGDTVTLFVGPEMVDCVGVGPQQCMLVRADPADDYEFFYQTIEGFNFEPGFEYELLVQVDTVENPPADGSSLSYTLVEIVSQTPVETADAGSDVTTTLFVGPELVECTGVAPQQCLQVRTDPTADYTLFYDTIQGFSFEPGFEYELLVRVDTVDNPPADGSSLTYTLVEVVSQTPAEMTETEAMSETRTMYVGPLLAPCVGVGPMECMLVKEDPAAGYQLFYDQIEGFTFEPGFEYELLVQVDTVENPPADGSSLKYTLIEEVSRTAVDARTLYVGPEMVECTGVAPQMCLLIRESPDAEYTFFYDTIEGFEFEPGVEQEIFVVVTPVENPPADGSSLQYTWIWTANRTPVEDASMAATESIDIELALEGPRWVLTSYLNADGQTVDALPQSEATATFEEGVVAGNGSCNRYTGAYTTDGNVLTVSQTVSTMMACLPDIMAQEQQFLANLQLAASYSIEGDMLMIANAEGATTLTFVAGQEISLTGTEWGAVNYNNGNQAVVSLILDTAITANFGEDGQLSGSAGCNNYTASYTVEGENISIGPAASTRMFCAEPEGIMEQEAQYLAALSTAATWSIDGTQLTLRTADGAMVANFQPVAPME